MPRALSVAVGVSLLAACGGRGGGSALTPSIAQITPRGGPPSGGTDVVITGSGFAQGATATFGGVAATDLVWVSGEELHVNTPAHAAGSVEVQVRDPGGAAANLPFGFTYADAPVALTPAALRAPVGASVALDGTLSSDLSFLQDAWQWSLASRPPGSAAVLADATSPVAHLTADVPGTYQIQLVVSNDAGSSAAATTTLETITTGSKVPDSGQFACYDEVQRTACPAAGASRFGQDGQYAIRPPSLSADAATVPDAVTGLVWQRTADPTKHNWYEATGTLDAVYNPAGVDVCGELVLAGQVGWRLPTRRELFTLLRFDYVIGQPLADVAAFPDTLAGNYWTSTPPPPNISVPWAVDFQLGRATYGFGSQGSGLSVRCVRGSQWGASAFTDQGDGTVRDDGTGLVWEKAAPVVARTWAAALAYCEALTLAGGGWRLPSVKEMDAFIGGSQFDLPAADLILFPNTQIAKYWTSTTDPLSPAIAYVGDMAYGWIDSGESKSNSNFARCVR